MSLIITFYQEAHSDSAMLFADDQQWHIRFQETLANMDGIIITGTEKQTDSSFSVNIRVPRCIIGTFDALRHLSPDGVSLNVVRADI